MTPFDNNNLFDKDGHLTDVGLQALLQGNLDELGSLEAAEHLDYCNVCLEKYTELLAADPEALLAPAHDIVRPVQDLLRMRSIRVLTNRYVSVAAAVVLAFGIWCTGNALAGSLPAKAPAGTPAKPAKPTFSVSESLSGALNGVSQTFNKALNDLQTQFRGSAANQPAAPATKGE